MNPKLITVNIPRDVFDECVRLSPGFRATVIDAYAANMMPPTERIHREMMRMMRESRDSSCHDGFNKIAFIKKIREDAADNRMSFYFMTYPGFLTGSNEVSMGLADAKRLAEHYILNFRNFI